MQRIANGRYGRRERVENLAAAISKTGKCDVVKERRHRIDECGPKLRRLVEERGEFRIPVTTPDVAPFLHQLAFMRAIWLHDTEIRVVPIGLRRGDKHISARSHHPQRLLRGAAVVLDMFKHVKQRRDSKLSSAQAQASPQTKVISPSADSDQRVTISAFG